MNDPRSFTAYVKLAWAWIAGHPSKFAIVVAIYLAAFWLLGPFGIAGYLAAFFSGTAVSGVVVLFRGKNAHTTMRFATFTLFGAVIGGTCLGAILLPMIYLYDHGDAETEKSCVMGAVVGVLVGALLAEVLPKS
jgi:hypothetical protein